MHVEGKRLVYGQDEEFVFSFEIAQTLKQFIAFLVLFGHDSRSCASNLKFCPRNRAHVLGRP